LDTDNLPHGGELKLPYYFFLEEKMGAIREEYF